MKKLTLSAKESTIETAKRLADESGMSVSAMFERIILFLDAQKHRRNSKIGPVTRKLTGIIQLPGDVNGGDVLEAILLEEHGLN